MLKSKVKLKHLSLGFLVGAFAFIGSSHSSPLAEISVVIPKKSVRPEASDLYLNGTNLTPGDARRLSESGTDISLLDPDPTTDIWHPKIVLQNDDLGFYAQKNEVDFVRILDSPVKNFRFVISQTRNNGERTMYQVLLGKRLQTYLLRRNLLRKLGYMVPPMQYVSELHVRFRSSLIKEDFIYNKTNGLKWNALGDKEWVLNLEDKNSSILKLQDVVIMPAQAEVVNVALGYMQSDFILGRRVLNALFLPYALVDVRESVNGFRWHPGLIKSEAVYLPLEDYEDFTTTWADARWIARRIATLTRTDFMEIVSGIGYPVEAEKLLTEKLISRRNEMLKLFELAEAPMEYNPGVSHGELLKDGELLKGDWPGLAARLAFEEEPSIISGPELKALFKSKAISTIIGELVRRVNEELIPRTDIEKKIFEKQKDKFLNDLVKFVKTGKMPKNDIGIWTTPFYAGRFIASREVVAGGFLGSDNRVQLVDTLGIGLDAGLYIGTLGLKPEQLLDGRAGLYYVREYSHLRPLKNIDSAVKEPYKNMLVPLLQRKWAGSIESEVFAEWDELSKEVRDERLRKIVADFKDKLGDGESIIITDNIVAGAAIRGGYTFTERVQAQANFSGQKILLSRLQILRQGDQIQVYKDLGNVNSLAFVFNMRAGIEVLSLKVPYLAGKASTNFYHVSIDTDLDQDHLAKNLLAIKALLLEKGTARLSQLNEPITLMHKLSESQNEVTFLFWNYLRLRSFDNLELKRGASSEPEHYIRRFIGERKGLDYQTVGVNLINEMISELTDTPMSIPNSTSGDPADTLFGKSRARLGYYEAELSQDRSHVEEAFIGINYRWRGWKAKRNELEKIINQFSQRFQFNFFHAEALKQVRAAELYSMYLRVFVYEKGIRHALSLDNRTLLRILKEDWASKEPTALSDAVKTHKELITLQKKYHRAYQAKSWQLVGDTALRFISLTEKKLTHTGFIKVVGDTRNVWIQPTLTGFLAGEDGKLSEVPIEGNEIGMIGSDRPFGPMTSTQQELGMSEGEFFVYWMLRRI
jgi:hypothetical protein